MSQALETGSEQLRSFPKFSNLPCTTGKGLVGNTTIAIQEQPVVQQGKTYGCLATERVPSSLDPPYPRLDESSVHSSNKDTITDFPPLGVAELWTESLLRDLDAAGRDQWDKTGKTSFPGSRTSSVWPPP